MDKNKLFLTQTDTTVGFLSRDIKKLSDAKNRDINQPFLICVDSYKKLNQLTQVPKKYRKLIRNSSKSSFLYPNKKAVRVVKDIYHSRFLKEFDFLYSSSANRNREKFDLLYAKSKADIIIEDERGLYESEASNIFKLGKKRVQKLR
jgi:tRNA A37 threonylcarbamoyladenosine synthetase subunit TsaC/SUA5/YrdC